MLAILLGAVHKSGCFEDGKGQSLEYDNLELTLAKEVEPVKTADRNICGVGQITTIGKCAWSNFENVFGGKISKIEELDDYLGCQINCFFDDKKKLDTVIL